MAEAESGFDGVLYEERQWASGRIMAFFFFVPVGGCGLIYAAIAMGGGSVPWSSVPWVIGLGIAGILLIWGMQVVRKMQVRENVLQMGSTAIPFGDIASVRWVQGEEAKAIRNVIAGAPSRRGGFVVSKREWRSIHGSWQQPWMRDAVFVQLKPTSHAVTDKWIIGTRHPEQLLQLVQDGMARAEAPTPAAASSV